MSVPQSTRPQSQFKAEQSKHRPLCLFPATIFEYACSNKPESRFVQRVNRHEGCWYHNRQDHDPSLKLSNVAEGGIWWEQKLIYLYVSVCTNKNIFHIDSYVIDQSLNWSALYEG